MNNLFRLIVLSLFTVMTNPGLQAQQPNNGFAQPNNHGFQTIPHDSIWRAQNKEIKGNPFLFEDWETKGIVYSQGNMLEGDRLNYNIYTNEIMTLKEKDSVFIYDGQYIDSVKINDKRLHKLDGTFYEILQTGSKASLYKKHETRIARGQFNPTDGTKQQNRLVIMDDYYVLYHEKLMKFRPSNESLNNTFGDQAQEIKKIMKAGNLDYKKEDDLIRIFEIFNSL